MESKEKDKQNEKEVLILTEEDIDAISCYKHFLPEQKKALAELVYEMSLALYKLYYNHNEST